MSLRTLQGRPGESQDIFGRSRDVLGLAERPLRASPRIFSPLFSIEDHSSHVERRTRGNSTCVWASFLGGSHLWASLLAPNLGEKVWADFDVRREARMTMFRIHKTDF